ncbi:MAG: GGDEF domain-containing protein [Paraglaciecola sp.]|uniref:GGDEF domain-containing protein n=1 Tax=Paraglaciecola sp. TaxID=1920173 RepID=UPI0032661126
MMLLYTSYMVLLAISTNREYSLLVEKQFSLTKLNQEDGLSGIFNRRFFDKSLDSAWKTSMRSQTSMVLVLIDIDFFKKVNDQYGHAVGDQVIKNVAAIIQNYCRRENDVAARIDGEEFAMLTSNYSHENFDIIAEKIRAQIASKKMEIDGNSIAVSCSFGVAVTIPAQDKSISEFYKQADTCLYAAKNAGRNRVFCKNY